MRDREEREKHILQAMGRIFIRDGISGIGINSIAREADCSKVLLYRYFGDLNGLYRAFAEEVNILDYDQMPSEDSSIIDQVTKIFLTQLETMRGSKLLQEVMKFEMLETNSLTEILAAQREENGLRQMDRFTGIIEKTDIDIAAVTALISAGISYLVLRSTQVSHFNGIDVQSEAGWKRIEAAIVYVITLVFKDMDNAI